MIARKICPFPLDHFSSATARIQSWMPVMGSSSGSSRPCIAEQLVKGTQRG
jgi:hypothetical protein